MTLEELQNLYDEEHKKDSLNLIPTNYNVYIFLNLYSKYDEHIEALKTLTDYNAVSSYVEQVAERNKKLKHKINDQKTRFRKRLKEMNNPYFITLTFTDEALASDFRRKIREYLKSYNISFCLVSDYGTNGGRFHYHGIVDIPNNSPIMTKSISQKTGKVLRAEHNLVVYEIPYFTEKLGYNGLTKLRISNKARESTLKYIFKYIYKNPNREIFASRTYKRKLF